MSFVGSEVVQVIDLEDSSRSCTLKALDVTSTTRPFGGLTTALEPMLCLDGGKCYVYRYVLGNWNWILEDSLNAGRYEADSCQSPVNGQLWISGGSIAQGEQFNVMYKKPKQFTQCR